MSITSERFIVLVLSLLYVVAVFCFSSSALPAQQKGTSDGVSNGTNKVDNFQATKDKYELSELQASKKPAINQENARVSTSQKTRVQKISEMIAESTTKKMYTQKMFDYKTTEKPAQLNSSSNKNDSTNSSNKNRNSNGSGGNFNSSDKTNNTNSSNISGSNISSNASIDEARKKPFRAVKVDFDFSSDPNPTRDVTKRYLKNEIFTAELEDSSKPIKIEVKTFTAPPNTSAIIEVRPTMSNTNEIDIPNNLYQNWPSYKYKYPQEINGPHAWYFQQYQPSLPAPLTYVPTEELLYSQSFSNTPGFGSQLLYQYPVKDAVYKRPSFPPISKYVFPNLRNNQAITPKPDPTDDYNLLPNNAVEPLARVFPHQYDMPPQIQHTPPQIQYSLPQNFYPPYFLPRTNGIQNAVNTQGEANLKTQPTVTKYVTKSYILKTSPKLEWVPL